MNEYALVKMSPKQSKVTGKAGKQLKTVFKIKDVYICRFVVNNCLVLMYLFRRHASRSPGGAERGQKQIRSRSQGSIFSKSLPSLQVLP